MRLTRALLDLSVALEVEEGDLFHEFRALLAPLPSLPKGAPFDLLYRVEPDETGYRIRRNRVLLAEGVRREELLAVIQGDLAFVCVQSRTFGLFHAAALLKRGKAVLLPGERGSGKSTLSAALLRGGFTYLSDEFSPLTLRSLTVRPYPLPLRLREGTLPFLPPLEAVLPLWPHPFWARGERVFYGLPASRLVVAEGEWPVGLIVFPHLQVGGPTEARRLKPGIAALRLLALMLNADLLGEAGFAATADLVSTIPCYTLTVGEVGAATGLIEALTGERDG